LRYDIHSYKTGKTNDLLIDVFVGHRGFIEEVETVSYLHSESKTTY